MIIKFYKFIFLFFLVATMWAKPSKADRSFATTDLFKSKVASQSQIETKSEPQQVVPAPSPPVDLPPQEDLNYIWKPTAKHIFFGGLGINRFTSGGDATISFRDYETYAPTLSFVYTYSSYSSERSYHLNSVARLDLSFVQFEEDDENLVSREVKDIPLLITYSLPTFYNMISYGPTFFSLALKAEYFKSHINEEELFRNQNYSVAMLGLTWGLQKYLDSFQVSIYHSLFTNYEETENIGKSIDKTSIFELNAACKPSIFANNLLSMGADFYINFRYQRLLVDYKKSSNSILQTYLLGLNKAF